MEGDEGSRRIERRGGKVKRKQWGQEKEEKEGGGLGKRSNRKRNV